MTIDPSISYHLDELEIAKSPNSPKYSRPEFSGDDQAILDIGCGIGQTFVALPKLHGRLLIGFDVDLKCLTYGSSSFDYIIFVNGTAEQLPFSNKLFDLVVSRVSLPYTNIPHTLAEIERVLKKDSRVWITLHSFSMTWKNLVASLRKFMIKDIIYRCYVILNGVIFSFSGIQFPFLKKRKYESFQTISGMKKPWLRLD